MERFLKKFPEFKKYFKDIKDVNDIHAYKNAIFLMINDICYDNNTIEPIRWIYLSTSNDLNNSDNSDSPENSDEEIEETKEKPPQITCECECKCYENPFIVCECECNCDCECENPSDCSLNRTALLLSLSDEKENLEKERLEKEKLEKERLEKEKKKIERELKNQSVNNKHVFKEMVMNCIFDEDFIVKTFNDYSCSGELTKFVSWITNLRSNWDENKNYKYANHLYKLATCSKIMEKVSSKSCGCLFDKLINLRFYGSKNAINACINSEEISLSTKIERFKKLYVVCGVTDDLTYFIRDLILEKCVSTLEWMIEKKCDIPPVCTFLMAEKKMFKTLEKMNNEGYAILNLEEYFMNNRFVINY